MKAHEIHATTVSEPRIVRRVNAGLSGSRRCARARAESDDSLSNVARDILGRLRHDDQPVAVGVTQEQMERRAPPAEYGGTDVRESVESNGPVAAHGRGLDLLVDNGHRGGEGYRTRQIRQGDQQREQGDGSQARDRLVGKPLGIARPTSPHTAGDKRQRRNSEEDASHRPCDARTPVPQTAW
jgi:hypothetical protein